MVAVTSVPAVRTRSLFLLLALGGAWAVAGAPPAAADCSGPTVEFEPAEVGRGGEVTVVGLAFGDNCYDTGPPPEGEGTLGVPQSDVQVLVVQGDEEILVAKGDAGDDYRFEVTVVVPGSLTPGPARLVVRLASGTDAFLADDGLTITDAAPIEGADESVVAFGGATGEPTDVTEQDDPGSEAAADDGTDLPLVPIGVGLLVAALAACVLYPLRVARRRAGDAATDAP